MGEQTEGQAYVARRLADLREQVGQPGYPTEQTIRAAARIASDVVTEHMPTPSVVPGEDGAVDFVWRKAGWDVSLEVTSHVDVFLWAKPRDGELSVSGQLGNVGRTWGAVCSALTAARCAGDVVSRSVVDELTARSRAGWVAVWMDEDADVYPPAWWWWHPDDEESEPMEPHLAVLQGADHG